MIRVSGVALRLAEVPRDFKPLVARLTGWRDIVSVSIARKSVDARQRSAVKLEYAFDVTVSGSEADALRRSRWKSVQIVDDPAPFSPPSVQMKTRPVVVGAGPAGILAALALAEAGANPLVVERGRPVADRRRDVQRFWKEGRLDTESNVQFGEGGAGAFSDGKLNSGIKKDAFTRKVLAEFVAAGAPEDILYSNKPHIGTDRLSPMLERLRACIESLGGEYRFETRLDDIDVKDGRLRAVTLSGPAGREVVPVSAVVLAVGHSARDTFEMLYRRGVLMVQKPFAVGARIEHLQTFINQSRYGTAHPDPLIGAADYKLAVRTASGRGVYTFCMCPGGYVVAAASEDKRFVTNGMSEYARDGVNANSAVLVDVRPDDFQSDHPLAGVEFQRRIEEKAFAAGGGNWRAPVQRVVDFLAGRETTALGAVAPSCAAGTEFADLRAVLPPFVADAMKEGFALLNRKIYDFAGNDAVLTAAETRSSSPVRMTRDPASLESVSVAGLYPCGEGAGYAGGILSAAADGLRCADRILQKELDKGESINADV